MSEKRSGRQGSGDRVVIPFPGTGMATALPPSDGGHADPTGQATAANLLADGRTAAAGAGGSHRRPRRKKSDRTFQLNVRVARDDLERLIRIVDTTGWTQAAAVSAALTALEGIIAEQQE